MIAAESSIGVAGSPFGCSGNFSSHDGVIRQDGARTVSALKECGINDGFEYGAYLAAALEADDVATVKVGESLMVSVPTLARWLS